MAKKRLSWKAWGCAVKKRKKRSLWDNDTRERRIRVNDNHINFIRN